MSFEPVPAITAARSPTSSITASSSGQLLAVVERRATPRSCPRPRARPSRDRPGGGRSGGRRSRSALSSESNGVTIAVTIVPSRGLEIWGAIRGDYSIRVGCARGFEPEEEAQMEDLLRGSATQMARAMREREVSPVELVEAHIARAEKVNGEVNALVLPRFEQALEEARDAEQALAGSETSARSTACRSRPRSRSRSPGWPCTDGSLLLQGQRLRRGRRGDPQHPRRRRDPARQDQHPRAGNPLRLQQPRLRGDPQPAHARPHGQRILRRRGRGDRNRHERVRRGLGLRR